MFTFPAYPKKAHYSGQARIRVRKRDYYLGKFGSDESRREYARLARAFADDPENRPSPKGQSVLSIRAIVALWSEAHPQGKEAGGVLQAAVPMLRLFGDELAEDFSAAKLETVRDAMVSASWMTAEEVADRKKQKKLPGWSRNYVRHQINRIKRIFRWAERRGHVPRGTWEHLRTLPPLEKSSPARKNPKRKAVDPVIVEKTLPHLSLMLQAMVKVQLSAGLRPSELCRMTVGAINRSEEIWVYRLDQFKTDHLDDADEWQLAMLGPTAQEALKPWLDAAALLGPETYVWRPFAMNRPISTEGFSKAIRHACRRGNVPLWCPYQNRHLAKRRAEQIAGEQGARAFLRQRAIESTRQYANHQDVETAKRIALKIG